MAQFHTLNHLNSAARPGLVCVFAGGTSGIGEATLRALTAKVSSFTIYIIGRNERKASQIIQECCPADPTSSSPNSITFLKADLTLLENVDKVCAEIKQRASKVDVLLMSQGYLTLQGRNDTPEGIDALMCLRYYSRMRFLHNLLPLPLQTDRPRVISIFAPGHESTLYPGDLSLRNPRHYGLFTNNSHVCFMTTFFFESIIVEYPKLSCLHVYPGLVKTTEFENGLFPGWLKWFFAWIMLPLLTPFCIPLAECGRLQLENILSARYMSLEQYEANVVEMGRERVNATVGVDRRLGSGVYAIDWNGEVMRKCEAVYEKWRKKNMKQLVWDHTMDAFGAVTEGRVFEG